MSKRMKNRLRELAVEAWAQHRRAERSRLPHLVRPSMPILFFGDSDRFAASRFRIITVGLNPSRNEFPPASPFLRFPSSKRLSSMNSSTYLGSLNGYFRTAPYTGWFDPSFEPILRGLGASYYNSQESCALHTDICSPLATDPTWGDLGLPERTLLEAGGKPLWHELVEVLQPDVALISVARAWLSKIEFPLVGPPRVIHTVDGPERKRPYEIEAFRHKLASGKTPIFVFGQASQTPFGSVSGSEKQRIGARILQVVNA